MKKKLLLFSSALFLAGTTNAQSWVEENTVFNYMNTGIIAGSIKIYDSNNAWALGYDGGNNIPSYAYLKDFVVTQNGGSTWTAKTLNTGTVTIGDSIGISNITLVNASTAYAGLFDANYSNAAAIGIWKTTDFGTTWTKTTAPFTTASWVDAVHFFDANNGVAFGDPVGTPLCFEVYTTADGGNTWTHVPNTNGKLTPIDNGEYGEYGTYCALGNTIWTGTNRGRIYKSTDMGLTWSVSSTPLTNGATPAYVGRIAFRDANNGLSTIPLNTGFQFIKTTDGGTTWTKITPATSIYSGDICAVPGTNAYVTVGAFLGDATNPKRTGSSISVDDGATWSLLTDTTGSTQLTSVAFLNSNTGYAGSFNNPAPTGGMYAWSGTVLGIKENPASVLALNTYPNPSNGRFSLSLEGFEGKSAHVKICTMLGQSVYEETGVTETKQLDLSSLPTGIYLATVTDGKNVLTKKVSIQ